MRTFFSVPPAVLLASLLLFQLPLFIILFVYSVPLLERINIQRKLARYQAPAEIR
jgi:hypothetical protein